MLSDIRGDFTANGRQWTKPGFHAMIVHRFASWIRELPRPLRLLLIPFYGVGFVWIRNVYGIELPYRTKVGRRFCIGHQSGIVIHPFAEIGDDCTIRQNVTLGAANEVRWMDAPTLGNRVEVGAGAVIVGKVKIGDGAKIGPNAVVMSNIPAGAMVVSPPCRVVPAAAPKISDPRPMATAAPSGRNN